MPLKTFEVKSIFIAKFGSFTVHLVFSWTIIPLTIEEAKPLLESIVNV